VQQGTFEANGCRAAPAVSRLCGVLRVIVGPGVRPRASTQGPATDPFPDAVPVGSPEVSRAVYGYLAPSDSADIYTFEVSKPTTAPVGILVPQGPGAAGFHPELTIYGGDKPVGMFDRAPGERDTFYEPFAQTTLYRGPEQDVGFLPGRPYYLIVTPGVGAVRSGRYVVSMGTVEAFAAEDVLRVPGEIARIKAGDYGGAPADWGWTVPWGLGLASLAAGLVAVSVWAVRRRRRAPRPAR
jgi:hypothetical protein